MMSKQTILFSFFIFVAQNAGAWVEGLEIQHHFNDTDNVGACIFEFHWNSGAAMIDALCMQIGPNPIVLGAWTQYYEPHSPYYPGVPYVLPGQEYMEDGNIKRSLNKELSELIRKRICEDYLFAILTYGTVSSFLPENNPWGVEFSDKEEEECEKKAIALKESRKAAKKENQKCLRWKQKSGGQKNYPSSKKGQRKNRYGGR